MDVIVTITEYKQHLKVLGYAPSSVACYGRGLDMFGKYLQAENIDDLRKVTKQNHSKLSKQDHGKTDCTGEQSSGDQAGKEIV